MPATKCRAPFARIVGINSSVSGKGWRLIRSVFSATTPHASQVGDRAQQLGPVGPRSRCRLAVNRGDILAGGTRTVTIASCRSSPAHRCRREGTRARRGSKTGCRSPRPVRIYSNELALRYLAREGSADPVAPSQAKRLNYLLTLRTPFWKLLTSTTSSMPRDMLSSAHAPVVGGRCRIHQVHPTIASHLYRRYRLGLDAKRIRGLSTNHLERSPSATQPTLRS